MTVLDHDHDPTGPSSGAPRGSSSPTIADRLKSPWGVVLLGLVAVLVVDAGGTDDGAGVCLFRRCTGGYCPGCGMTRAARHLTRGQVGAAWQDHPIIVLLAAQALVGGALYAFVSKLRVRLRSTRTLATLAAVNGVLLVAIWIVRLVDGSIPRFF